MAKDKMAGPEDEEKEEVADAEKPGESSKRARGGHLEMHKMPEKMLAKRKRGGKVPGKEAMMRPDRRARGGGVSDLHPGTSAGNMSKPSYEDKQPSSFRD